jgi:ubiquinone/menaquinone biosynthesis C-methylase UbiE
MKAEDYADLYELEERLWWFVGMRAITAALLDPFCRGKVHERILDSGCGTGGMLSWLARYNESGRMFGLDVAHDAVSFCQKRGYQTIVQASAIELPFPDTTFDLVTSFDVLVQLPGQSSDEIAMREMHRVLRPGGVAFVRVAAYRWMMSGHDKALGTQRRYTRPELTAKLTESGFRVIRATYVNTFLLPLAIVRRLLFKRIGLSDDGSDVKPLPKSMGWLNGVFAAVLRFEAWVVQRRINLPAGLSLICIVMKDG